MFPLVDCGPDDERANNAPSSAYSAQAPSTDQPEEDTTQSTETTPRTTEEASNLEPPTIAKTVATEIDKASIRAHLVHLTGASPAPLEGGVVTITERGSVNGRRAAAEYMEKSFEEMGIPARILEFTSDEGRGFNVEAILRGTEGEKHLWVTAHLDSVGNAGANDDASGLVSILMTARALKRLDPEHTVHFVAYDLEEVGLVGSSVYMRNVVSAIRAQGGDKVIIGNLHHDMIGYEEGEFDAELVTCDRGGAISETVVRASEAIGSPVEFNETCLPGRSDHHRFWDAGLPAAWMFERGRDNPYPWHHEPGDTIDKLNITYLRSMIQLTVATTVLLAGPD
jgi:hypothetical protein